MAKRKKEDIKKEEPSSVPFKPGDLVFRPPQGSKMTVKKVHQDAVTVDLRGCQIDWPSAELRLCVDGVKVREKHLPGFYRVRKKDNVGPRRQ